METVINDAVVISCHSRESGNPGTSKYRKYWILAIVGMTNECVILTFCEFIRHNFHEKNGSPGNSTNNTRPRRKMAKPRQHSPYQR